MIATAKVSVCPLACKRARGFSRLVCPFVMLGLHSRWKSRRFRAPNPSPPSTKSVAAGQQLLTSTEQNFFSALEIYFKALEIYFSGLEIYFKAFEIVLCHAERKISARRAEIVNKPSRIFRPVSRNLPACRTNGSGSYRRPCRCGCASRPTSCMGWQNVVHRQN